MENDRFDRNLQKSQMLTLEDRSKFTVGLVENVENFSDTQIMLKTALGGLCITGSGLKLEDLSIENGTIILTGKIDKIDFADLREKRSFFQGLFR